MTEEECVECTSESEALVVSEDAESVEVCAEVSTADEEQSLAETLGCLEAELAEANKKAAEYLDGWQRSQATFANFRKRTEAEQVTWRSAANAGLLSRLLPVADDFVRAFQVVPEEFEGHSWLGGITLIQRKVASILESENVKPIELDIGDTFDPLYHQAVFYQEVDGFEEGQIVAEVERGYILGERVLRPSSVVVAKAPVKAAESVLEVTGEIVEVVPEADSESEASCCDEAECCCHCDES
jgi:molecular chaperone GrpE